MKYLVLEDNRSKICTDKTLRAWLNHTKGGVRVFRLCGLNEPVEQRLSAHCGHNVAIVKYGIGCGCYTLECNDCNEVICDTDIYDLCGKE